jgi:uncharacterized protein YjbI with pentapeptide repeats
MLTTKMIGNKIAEARKRLNISQSQLAQRLFISSQAVGKWERGESMPDPITFNRLAEILGVDLNYFSENFQSITSENVPVESSLKQSVEWPSKEQKKNLSWDMSRGNWVDADFSGLKNLHEKFSSSNIRSCKFIGSELTKLFLRGNNIDSCEFSNSDISNSQIQGSNLHNDVFKNCSLIETEFSGSNIEKCDFSGANLTGSEFSKSSIYGCNFTGANFTGVIVKSGGFSGVVMKPGDSETNPMGGAIWNGTSFLDTQIADIIFTGTLEDCSFENCGFTRVTFQNVTIINTFFKNKSLKRIRFIDCKADRMTYEFLKAGKANLTGVTLFT